MLMAIAVFEQANQERLFKSVVQFDANKLQKGGGTGLGLLSEFVCLSDRSILFY